MITRRIWHHIQNMIRTRRLLIASIDHHRRPPGGEYSPFDQFHHDEIVAVAAVEEDEAVGRGGLELHEEVHGVVGLQRGQRDEAGARSESDRVGHDALVADDGVELAVVNVAVLAQVDVGHAVERQALQVPDEVGRHGRHEALLRHDARLHVVELQLRVVARHLIWGWPQSHA